MLIILKVCRELNYCCTQTEELVPYLVTTTDATERVMILNLLDF